MVSKIPRSFAFLLLSDYMFWTLHFSGYFNRLLINNRWEIWYSHTTQIYLIFIISFGKSSHITIIFKCKCRVTSLNWKIIHIMPQFELERLVEIEEQILIETVPGEKWTCKFFGCFLLMHPWIILIFPLSLLLLILSFQQKYQEEKIRENKIWF